MPTRLSPLVLLVLVAIAAGDVPRPLPRPVQVHEFEALPHRDALQLAGKPALYAIALDSQAEEIDGRIAVDCTSADAVHRTPRPLPGVDVETRDRLTVRARLRVIRHPPSWGFPELVEYRLLDAAPVR